MTSHVPALTLLSVATILEGRTASTFAVSKRNGVHGTLNSMALRSP